MISIAIVNYRSQQYLGDCLASIERHHSPAEVECIIVDNNSGENLDSIISPYRSWVRVVYHTENNGFGAGMNRAFQEVRGDWILCLNPDITIDGSVVEVLIQQPVTTAAVGFALRRPSGTFQEYHMGAFLTPKNVCFRNGKKDWKQTFSEASATQPVQWSSGGALAIRRGVFEAVGGFDEGFFMYYEDMDLCYRIQEDDLGGVIWSPSPVVLHTEGGSQPDKVKMKQRFYLSQRYYLRKRGWWWLSTVLWPLHWLKVQLI